MKWPDDKEFAKKRVQMLLLLLSGVDIDAIAKAFDTTRHHVWSSANNVLFEVSLVTKRRWLEYRKLVLGGHLHYSNTSHFRDEESIKQIVSMLTRYSVFWYRGVQFKLDFERLDIKEWDC